MSMPAKIPSTPDHDLDGSGPKASHNANDLEGLADAQVSEAHFEAYWQANLRLVGALLSIWFLVSYGAGVLFVDTLNQFHLPGMAFPLGFWFAQQGAIYVFVVLIVVYAILMNRLEARFGVAED